MKNRVETEARVMINLGIIQQLMATRQLKLFKNLAITYSQFSLLAHFSHNPDRSWTVSELAKVMEMNQPGITKVISNLLNKKLMSAQTDQLDSRKRQLKVTLQGLNLYQQTMHKLLPDAGYILKNWKNKDLKEFQQHLEKLMQILDSHREDLKL